MKPTITSLAMLLLGTIIGFVFAPALFQWLASAFGAPLIVTSPGESFVARFQFAVGCGALFAAAPIASTLLARLSRPMRWAFFYLLIGCVVSSAVAVFYHATYSSALADLQQLPPMATAVSLSALPTLRIPLIGALAIICVGLFHRLISRPHDTSNPQVRNA